MHLHTFQCHCSLESYNTYYEYNSIFTTLLDSQHTPRDALCFVRGGRVVSRNGTIFQCMCVHTDSKLKSLILHE